MSTVYFIEADADAPTDELEAKLKRLFDKAGFSFIFRPNDISALKLHVGEPGTRTYLKPEIAAVLVDCMKESGATPFLTDTSVLYRSPRDTGVGHAEVAAAHGFGVETTGAPFIPADGVLGKDGVMLPIFGKHFEEVSIAAAIVEARSMLVLSHVTGHLGTGFGATLKNLGMGCSTKKAKLAQHHGQHPKIVTNRCIACGTCSDHCPAGAVLVAAAAIIDTQKCIGCGECITTCREAAVAFDWSVMGPELEERIAEHAAAVARQKKGHICYITAAINMTKDCDCLGVHQSRLLPDIGFFAATDPVSLDQAIYDTITEKNKRSLKSMGYPHCDGTIQLVHAEKIGIGSRQYTLKRIEL